MSAFGGKADLIASASERPLIAISGHWRLFNWRRNVAHRDAGDGTRSLHHKQNWQMDETSPYLFEFSEAQI